MELVSCEECGCEFPKRGQLKRFCSSQCRARVNARLGRERHPEKHQERNRRNAARYRKETPDKASAAVSKWRTANKEIVQGYHKAYRTRHQERALASSRRWRINNPDKAKALLQNWRSRNPDKVRAQKHRRRALENGTEAFTAEEWSALKRQYGFSCLCCKRKEPEIKLEADHVLPLSCGGAGTIDNIQPLCRSCNAKKSDKYIDYRLKSTAA